MFKKIKFIAIITVILMLSGCSKVPAGYRGVIVNLYGSDKGISEQSVGVGRYWVGWNKEIYLFPTFLQNYTWTKDNHPDESITMQTNDGLTITTDVGITYSIQPNNVVKVFQKYRLGIDEITNTFLRNMVRDSMNQVASQMSIEQLYSQGKETFINNVNLIVKKEAQDDGIDVDKVYLIGSFRLPPTVIDSINSKIQATQNAQKVENEVATAQAEAQKTIIEAQARAKANEIINSTLTPQFIQYQALQRWNGVLPQVTSNAVPFVGITSDAK